MLLARRDGMASDDRDSLAESRTDWAEDRTIMANERTFAGWTRTGMAAVGIGIAFHALFQQLEPAWLPKVLATCFIVVGVVIFWLARRKSCAVLQRMSAHRAKPIPSSQMNLITALASIASIGLAIGLWMM